MEEVFFNIGAAAILSVLVGLAGYKIITNIIDPQRSHNQTISFLP